MWLSPRTRRLTNATRVLFVVHVVVLPWVVGKQIVPISATRGNTLTTFGEGRQHHDEAHWKTEGNVGKGGKKDATTNEWISNASRNEVLLQWYKRTRYKIVFINSEWNTYQRAKRLFNIVEIQTQLENGETDDEKEAFAMALKFEVQQLQRFNTV